MCVRVSILWQLFSNISTLTHYNKCRTGDLYTRRLGVRTASRLTRARSLSTRFIMFEGYRAIVSILIGLGKAPSCRFVSSAIHLGILLWLYNRFWVNRSFFRSRHSMQGKTVLVTGGADGIGYETAKDLLGRGSTEPCFLQGSHPDLSRCSCDHC